MTSAKLEKQMTRKLPKGYAAVPLTASQTQAPVKVCIVFNTLGKEDDASHFVRLREELDSTAYLGCMTDAGERVLQWLKVQVQKPDCLLQDWTVGDDVLTNRSLDLRWIEASQCLRDHDPGLFIMTGWEDRPPPPIFVDSAACLPWHPTDKDSDGGWVLCRDDMLLEQAGLPQYSTSTARYLYLPEEGENTAFVPVSAESPGSDRTIPLERLYDSGRTLVPFNPWSGFLLVGRLIPVGLGTYVDVLDGKPWNDVAPYTGSLPAVMPEIDLLDTVSTHADRGRLFIGQHSPEQRALETLYLKLLIFQSAVRQVRDFTESMGRPLLNLTDESFHVLFGAEAADVPFLWTAHAVLTDAGTAVAIDSNGGDQTFANLDASLSSAYAPLAARAPFAGHGTVRIRRADAQADGVVLEGTLAVGTANPEVLPDDLIRLRLMIEGKPVDLSAHGDESAALAANEIRFRSFPLPATHSADADRLTELEGLRFPQVPFQVIPRLGSPCDLYSLAVLACRVLLKRPSVRLAEILDEVQGLSHQIGLDDSEDSLPKKVSRVFAGDPRWRQVLGPETALQVDGADAAGSAIPNDLWWELLGCACRLFPQMGTHSICSTFAVSQPGAMHSIFDTALEDIEELGQRIRSLLLNDFTFNEEVRTIIDELQRSATS